MIEECAEPFNLGWYFLFMGLGALLFLGMLNVGKRTAVKAVRREFHEFERRIVRRMRRR